ncbi:hypothetical protein AVBRAN12640_08350 [Campylobacter sp. RM12640]|uniref:hypothetical protein n=1 Tax=unclassified Campylobacter TaxID=2593542 RepID=UPI001EFB4B5F|nr:hypothetical protein [Campylobacter sp. RM12651]MBZ7982545.1 hypothetical protein [Campylobacter sp. RM12640]MBZ7990130.1 hypothetical protein [Campylobacter sp. RM12635]ULO04085.1 hypothetical protein AVBRAN_1641 [Campylobacter sp. RM12651]
MKKAVLAILAFITNVSAYSWYSYTNGYSFLTWSGAWGSAFNSSARDRVMPQKEGWKPPRLPRY